MAEAPRPATPSVPEIQDRLQAAAHLLRRKGPLDREAKTALAELVDELGRILETTAVPPAEVTLLAESTAHLAEALQQQQQRELPVSVRERLERAVVRAEAQAPVAVGLARRLLDALANLGI
jgi:hypothetical protein